MKKISLFLSAVVCGFVLPACGGGSGGSSSTASTTPPAPVNSAPVALAVSSVQIVTEGQPFTLDASGSTDADNDSLTYSWSQISGPSVTLSSALIQFNL